MKIFIRNRSMLERNGSAVDAAVAAMICNGLINMQSMGFGGGFFMTIYKRENREAITLDARECAPRAAHPEMYDRLEALASQFGKTSCYLSLILNKQFFNTNSKTFCVVYYRKSFKIFLTTHGFGKFLYQRYLSRKAQSISINISRHSIFFLNYVYQDLHSFHAEIIFLIYHVCTYISMNVHIYLYIFRIYTIPVICIVCKHDRDQVPWPSPFLGNWPATGKLIADSGSCHGRSYLSRVSRFVSLVIILPRFNAML